ncbi:MAG: PAS domain S-box protein [Promethearchaeota archaeon]|jgi:PAS domain S-box-containing protein
MRNDNSEEIDAKRKPDLSILNSSQEKLETSEEMYKNIINNLLDIIIVLDLKGNFLYASPQVYNISGFTQEEIIGKNGFKLMHPDDIKEAVDVLKEAITMKKKIVIEYRTIHKDGHYIDVSASGKIVNIEGEDRIFAVVRDVSAQKKSKKKLIESEKKYRQLIEDSLEGVWVIDEDANTTLVNPSMARILGYEVDEMIGINLFDFTLQEDIETTKNTLERRRKGIKEEIEKKFVRKDGKEVLTRLMASPIFDNNGKYLGSIAFVSDITDRKKTETLLRESEEKFRTLFEIVPASIAVLDLNGNIVLYNQKFCDLHGVKNPELLEGKNIRGFFAEKDLPKLRKAINKSLEGTSRDINQYTMIKDDGTEFLAEAISVGFKDKNGKITGLIGVAQDVTEQIRAEQKLKESEEKFRMIAEHSFMGVLITIDNQIEYINNALLEMFEYKHEEIVNWTKDNIIQIIHPDDLRFLREYRKKLWEGDSKIKPYYSYRLYTKSGKLKWVDQFSTTINYKGRHAELVTVMDITEKKVAEQELVKLSSLKSELMRRTSHELKTPLVSIKGYSDLLLNVHREKLDDYVLASIVEIKQGCERLESLIQDILNTAELQSGVVQLNKNVDDLSFFIKLSVRELRGLAKLRNHTINLNTPDKLITSFEPEQIHQVISNLINNAIKYTPPDGTIEIASEIKDSLIIISIQDSGIGLTEKEKERLFTQFGKVERYGQGLDIISEGSGLGLYISKKIVELHGGKIWVESEGRNKGSTFRFSLPIIIESNE